MAMRGLTASHSVKYPNGFATYFKLRWRKEFRSAVWNAALRQQCETGVLHPRAVGVWRAPTI
jgi:hypothetical protein